MALPRLNFQPIVNPYTPLPIEELNTAIQSKRKDYEEGLELDSRARQAIATIKATDYDKPYLEEANLKLQQSLAQAKEKGDYENQKLYIQKALGEYTSKALPVQQREQEYKEFATLLHNSKGDLRVLDAIKREQAQNPTISEKDGYIFNNQNLLRDYGKYVTPDPNVIATLSAAAKTVEGNIKSFIGTDKLPSTDKQVSNNQIQLLVQGQKRWVDKEKVRALLTETMKGTDIDKYYETQKFILRSEEEERREKENILLGLSPEEAKIKAKQEAETFAETEIEKQKTAAIESVSSAIGDSDESTARQVVKSYSQLKTDDEDNESAKTKTGNGGENLGLYNIYGFGNSLNTSEGIKTVSDLNKGVKNIENSLSKTNDPIEQQILNIRLKRYNNIKTNLEKSTQKLVEDNILTQDELSIYNENIGKSLTDLGKELRLYENQIVRPNLDKETYKYFETQIIDLSNIIGIKRKVGNTFDSEIQKRFSEKLSFVPKTIAFHESKNPSTDKTTAQEVTNLITSDLNSYDIITQDGTPLNELINKMTEKDKERLTELTSSSGSISDLETKLNINRVTDTPIKDGIPALVGKVSTKYADLVGGQDIYFIPKQGYGSNVFNMISGRGVTNDTRNSTFKTLSALGDAAPIVEKQFNELIKYKPSDLEEGEGITIQPYVGFPIISFHKSGNKFKYQFKYNDKVKEGSVSDFLEIRDDYYNFIRNTSTN